MIFGEHDIGRLTVFATPGQPERGATALMGVRLAGDHISAVSMSRAEVERLRELCDEALS